MPDFNPDDYEWHRTRAEWFHKETGEPADLEKRGKLEKARDTKEHDEELARLRVAYDAFLAMPRTKERRAARDWLVKQLDIKD